MINFLIQYWLEILFGIIISVIGVLYSQKNKLLIATKAENSSMRTAIVLLLRKTLIDFYWKHKASGYCPIEDRETILALLKEYKCLGGNSNVSDLIEEIFTLPKKPA